MHLLKSAERETLNDMRQFLYGALSVLISALIVFGLAVGFTNN